MKGVAWRFVGALVIALSLGVSAEAQTRRTKPVVESAPPVDSDMALGFYAISRNDFLATYKRVGILPVELPPEFRERDDARRAIEDAAAKNLKLAKMDVVSSERYAAAYDRFNREFGGIYDAKTGELRFGSANIADKARKEFVTAEHLDGVVRLRVQVKSANFGGGNIYWDGVGDPGDGGTANDTEASRSIERGGHLPALSVLLEIFRTPDRVDFTRSGGIQPTAYLRWVEPAGSTFLTLTPDDLLKDLVRIERAARVATLPLVRTPQDISTFHFLPEVNATLIKATDLPPLPVAKALVQEPALLQPREQILKSVRRVALTRVYPDVFDLPGDVEKRILDRVRQELVPLQWEIIDAPSVYPKFVHLLFQNNLFDPYTGKRNEEKLSAARKAVIKSLGITPAPDAILWVSLVRPPAMHREGVVTWDGVSQDAITLGPVTRRRTFFTWNGPPNVGGGSIRTISFQAQLIDGEDTTLYRSRGGLQLAQKIVDPKGSEFEGTIRPIDLEASELFKDPAHEVTAVHLALRELTLTPEALAAERNAEEAGKPGKKAKKKKKA